jgi:hypothetical protein
MNLLEWFLEDRVRTLWLLAFMIIILLIAIAFVSPYYNTTNAIPFTDACTNWDSAYAGHPNIMSPTIYECTNTSRPAYLVQCCNQVYGDSLYYQKMIVNGGI